MPATIDAKSSLVRIRSALSRATSVPRSPIATPMCAARSAGASLAPSPVTATKCPSRIKDAGSAQPDRPQRLDGHQPPRDHLSRGHAPRPDGQRDRQRYWQPFRDSRRGERDGQREDSHHRAALRDGRSAERNDRACHAERDLPREPFHAHEQRGFRDLGHGERARDPPELRGETGRDDDGVGATARHERRRERHVDSITQARIGGEHRPRSLRHGQRLASEERLIGLDHTIRKQPDVCRDSAPRLEQNDVPRHELRGVELVICSVAKHVRLRHRERP
jgi:hypothetical protein